MDYKTDVVTEDHLLSLVEHYRGQVVTYASAWQAMLGPRVKKWGLYFTSSGQYVYRLNRMKQPAMAIEIEAETLTIRQLRRRWKPHKERLTAEQPENPTPIRFHRACSWIARVEQNAANEDHDLGLISLWIAFNSLYRQWDEKRREPKSDRESWRKFGDRILELDQDEVVATALTEHKRLVMSLLEDKYLSGYFWQEPSVKRAGQSEKAMYDARTWYIERRWAQILDRLLERVYLMRCQLVHGAATYGGKLNRPSLRRCVMMMHRLADRTHQIDMPEIGEK